MTAVELKKYLSELIDRNRDEIIRSGEALLRMPELSYKETKTSAFAVEHLEKLGLKVKKSLAITGFRADLDTGRPGPTIAIFGELDSLICANHPESDPSTGYVHACGHHAQCAALLGIAAALKDAA